MKRRRPAPGRMRAQVGLLLCALALVAAIAPPSRSAWSERTLAASSGVLARAFEGASRAYGVPAPLLLTVSYAETRWNVLLWNRVGADVYGPMSLYGPAGGPGTLYQAVRALGAPAALLQSDPAANVLGAAAVLAADERALLGRAPAARTPIGAWYGAVARYAGLRFRQPAREFADTVFALLARGVQGAASDGEMLRVAAQRVTPQSAQIGLLRLPPLPAQRAATPLAQAFIPVGGTGFEAADRPRDGLGIRYIVLHATDVDYTGAVRAFTNPGHCCAAHYAVDGEDGAAYPTLTQFVLPQDVAYHAGNYWYNQHAIGIEHVGFSDSPASYFTQRLYDASANLAGYLAAVYGIPIDRAHLIGHGNVPPPSAGAAHTMHWDPGPGWDWPYYLVTVRRAYARWTNNAAPPAPSVPPSDRALRTNIRVVAVGAAHAAAADIPAWSGGRYDNAIPVYADDGGRPSSQLVLGASDGASWRSRTRYDRRDYACDNLPASAQVGGERWVADAASDLRAMAEYGEAYARLRATTIAGVTWDEIDFNGVRGWIRDSETVPGWGVVVTFTGRSAPTDVYGAPILDRSDAICSDRSEGFSRAGQSYVAQAVDATAPGGPWYQIYYNHRLVWVPAREVIAK